MNALFRPRLAAIALSLIASAAPVTAPAQTAQAQNAAATAQAADPKAVVAAARALVREQYVIPETGAALDTVLADAAAKGRFDGLAGLQLADAITQVMRTVTPDGHLNASYNPAFAAQLAAASTEDAGDEGAPAELARQVALANGGVKTLEVLPGNVRYVDYTGFMWGAPAASDAITNAMEFLRGGSAIIIDLRHNGGGSGDAVADLASWFLPPDTPLMRFETRAGEEERTQTHAKPFTLADRPVYVLTSKRSFSAAEEFAAHVSAFGFGTLVGENTGGGGFNNTFYPLPGGLVISISTGQAVQLKTGKGWERVGIAPAIAVPQDRALDRAQAEALAKLVATAPAAEQAELARIEAVYRAHADPVAPAHPLADYVGTFGPFAVSLRGDSLIGVTPTGPSEIVALGGDTFAPLGQPAMRVEFVFDGGAATAVKLVTPNGSRSFPRS